MDRQSRRTRGSNAAHPGRRLGPCTRRGAHQPGDMTSSPPDHLSHAILLGGHYTMQSHARHSTHVLSAQLTKQCAGGLMVAFTHRAVEEPSATLVINTVVCAPAQVLDHRSPVALWFSFSRLSQPVQGKQRRGQGRAGQGRRIRTRANEQVARGRT